MGPYDQFSQKNRQFSQGIRDQNDQFNQQAQMNQDYAMMNRNFGQRPPQQQQAQQFSQRQYGGGGFPPGGRQPTGGLDSFSQQYNQGQRQFGASMGGGPVNNMGAQQRQFSQGMGQQNQQFSQNMSQWGRQPTNRGGQPMSQSSNMTQGNYPGRSTGVGGIGGNAIGGTGSKGGAPQYGGGQQYPQMQNINPRGAGQNRDAIQQGNDWVSQNQQQNQQAQNSGEGYDSYGHQTYPEESNIGEQPSSHNQTSGEGGPPQQTSSGSTGMRPGGMTWEQYAAQNPEGRDAYNNWLAGQLNAGQFGQQGQQFEQNFGEQQRQYNQNYARETANDQFQQGLSRDQFGWQKNLDQYGMDADTRNFRNQVAEFGQTHQLNRDALTYQEIQNLRADTTSNRQFDASQLQQNNQFNMTDRFNRDRMGQENQQFNRTAGQRDREFDVNTGLTRDQMRQQDSQFGRELGQRGHEFNVTTGQRNREFDVTAGQRNREFDVNTGLTRDQMRQQNDQFGRTLGLQNRELDVNQDQFGRSLNQRGKEFDVTTGLTRDQMNRAAHEFNVNTEEGRRQFNESMGFDRTKFQGQQDLSWDQQRYLREQLGQQGSLANRGYDIDERGLAQSGEIERERIAAQREAAILAATGRRQRQNARWMRSG